MKINPVITANVMKSYQVNKTELDKTKSVGKRDELTLSSEALSFSKALAKAKDEIEFRSTEEKTHIANITEMIRQGTYKVDSQLVAARIVDEFNI